MTRRRPLALVLSVFLLLAVTTSCGNVLNAGVEASSRPRELQPDVDQSEIRNVVEGNNAFALDLYEVLRAEHGNLVCSPYSISVALAMTYAGARGETEAEMSRAMYFEPVGAQLHPALNALDLAITARAADTADGQPLQLSIANATWAQQGYDFLPEYLDLLAANYGAGLRLADFQGNPEPARLDINRWVRRQTQNRIEDLLGKGSIGTDTRMVLVNAIYFKADWLQPFEKEDTFPAPFYLLDRSEVQVEMMSGSVDAPYASGPGYQLIELPYAGGTTAMDIFVPDRDHFEDLESALTSDGIQASLAELQPAAIELSLPKFRFSTDVSLAQNLRTLGASRAFDPTQADFSGMTGNRDLYISDAIHKAFVAVDEAGTEAAAATGVIMGVTSAPMPGTTLTIDRPFIFLIRDLQTGQILFLGRVLDPTQT